MIWPPPKPVAQHGGPLDPLDLSNQAVAKVVALQRLLELHATELQEESWLGTDGIRTGIFEFTGECIQQFIYNIIQ